MTGRRPGERRVPGGKAAGWFLVVAAAVAAAGLAAVLALAPGPPAPTGAPAAAGPPGAADRSHTAAPAGELSPTAARTVRPAASVLSVLQFNLCNSGFALDCYAGGAAVPEAAGVIAATRPDAVTLNEICRHDLTRLVAAVRTAAPADRPYWAFQPAYTDRGTPYLCKNGDQFGNAVIGHVPVRDGAANVRGGRFPMQVDPRIDEQRSWACVLVAGRYYVCATHLTAHSDKVALAQCGYLMNTAVPGAWAAMGGRGPTVIAGDFNLIPGGSPDLRGCIPPGWSRASDSVQHVLASAEFAAPVGRRIAMLHTDHPAWLVTVRPR